MSKDSILLPSQFVHKVSVLMILRCTFPVSGYESRIFPHLVSGCLPLRAQRVHVFTSGVLGPNQVTNSLYGNPGSTLYWYMDPQGACMHSIRTPYLFMNMCRCTERSAGFADSSLHWSSSSWRQNRAKCSAPAAVCAQRYSQ